MTMTGTHHRQAGKVLWEFHSRDEVRHGGKKEWLLTFKEEYKGG